MKSQPLIAPDRAAQLRTLALTLLLLFGLGAAAMIALWEPVADFLGEGAIRALDVDGGARRGIIAATLAVATLLIGHVLWRWNGLPRYLVGGVAALAALLAAGPLALPMVVLGIAIVAIEYVAPLERERLADAGPRERPLTWGVGVVAAAGFLAISAYLTWFLVSPLIDEGAELDEALAFAFSTPQATSAPSTPAATPAGATPAATADSMSSEATAALVAGGELMGADSFHFGSGQVLLIRDPDGGGLLRFEDYEVRNGPNLHVYLTPDVDGDVHVDGAVDLGEVRATRGNVNYELPAGADLESFRSVVIYCVPFRVVFATATLTDLGRAPEPDRHNARRRTLLSHRRYTLESAPRAGTLAPLTPERDARCR